MRTPLTYYGGKQQIAAQIVALMPPHRAYLEPFAGGAAVLFNKPRAPRETLNDLDERVVRFWRALRERPEDLANAVAMTPYSRREWRASRMPDQAVLGGERVVDDVEAARQLLVEIDQSFSRSRSSWSVPCVGDGRGRWQPGSWENLPPKLIAAAERLQGVALEHGDAITMLQRWDRDDAVIYCDPPYVGEHRREPSKGYACDADAELWDRLVDALAGIKHAAVILSGYPCEQAERLDWQMLPLARKRTVTSKDGKPLANAPEVVWVNAHARVRHTPTLWEVAA